MCVSVLCVPVKLVTTPVTARRFDPASRSVASTLPTTFSTFDPNVKLALSTNSLEAVSYTHLTLPTI